MLSQCHTTVLLLRFIPSLFIQLYIHASTPRCKQSVLLAAAMPSVGEARGGLGWDGMRWDGCRAAGRGGWRDGLVFEVGLVDTMCAVCTVYLCYGRRCRGGMYLSAQRWL